MPSAILSMLFIASGAAFAASHQFSVGGEGGWRKPTGNDTESFNFWASQHRFHVGDSLYFKFLGNDSVLVVNYRDYRDCVVVNPIARFENGSGVVFEVDRSGVLYFISGEAGHCAAGQKVVVRVMGESEEGEAPESAPWGSPDDGGDGWEGFTWGPPSLNSTVKTTLASYFVTALGGFLIVLYLLT